MRTVKIYIHQKKCITSDSCDFGCWDWVVVHGRRCFCPSWRPRGEDYYSKIALTEPRGNASKENPGNGWGTNSKARAKGEKQVFLRDGAMFIKRAAVADHGVSVTHDVAFQDVCITAKFMLPKQGDLGVQYCGHERKNRACRPYMYGTNQTGVA